MWPTGSITISVRASPPPGSGARRPASTDSGSGATTSSPTTTSSRSCHDRGSDAREPGSGVECFQRLAFTLYGAPIAPRELLERVQHDPTILRGPGAGDGAVNEISPHRERLADAEDERSIPFGQDLGPPRVDQQVRVPMRQEPDRGRNARIRQGRIRQVDE